MLDPASVPANQTALVVIDVQDSFLVGPRWARRSSLDFEAKITALVDGFRQAGRPVFFFLHCDRDDGFSVDHPAYKLMDFLVPRPGEPVLEKTTANCFTSTRLLPELLGQNIRKLVVTGILTEMCCETTARVGSDLGFAVDYVTEATLTFPIPLPGSPKQELGTREIIERTEAVLRGRFARISDVAGVLADLGL